MPRMANSFLYWKALEKEEIYRNGIKRDEGQEEIEEEKERKLEILLAYITPIEF